MGREGYLKQRLRGMLLLAISAFADSKEDNEFGKRKSPGTERYKDLPRNQWVPIGWERISELVQFVQVGVLQ
jgi:hypothetical protein